MMDFLLRNIESVSAKKQNNEIQSVKGQENETFIKVL